MRRVERRGQTSGIVRGGPTGTAAYIGVFGLVALFGTGCGGGPRPPAPGFGMLAGRTVLVLPVQGVRPSAGGWVGGARNGREAAREADAEIAFALRERGGRATWIVAEEQRDMLRRRPGIEVDPYALATDAMVEEGSKIKRIRDPLYGEVRAIAALFDTRYAVWPMEVLYQPAEGEGAGRVGIRTLFLDARTGDVLWQGMVYGTPEIVSSAAALASAAQAFADQVSP